MPLSPPICPPIPASPTSSHRTSPHLEPGPKYDETVPHNNNLDCSNAAIAGIGKKTLKCLDIRSMEIGLFTCI